MCLLSFAFYMLTQHPDIEHRLRKEIFEKVGATDSPTYEQMREMKYTRAFLNGMYHHILASSSRVDLPSRGSQTLPTCVSVSHPNSQKHNFHKRSSPIDSRTTNKPVVLPAKNGQPPIYIPANTKCIFFRLGLPR